jgi:hypothetical protein
MLLQKNMATLIMGQFIRKRLETQKKFLMSAKAANWDRFGAEYFGLRPGLCFVFQARAFWDLGAYLSKSDCGFY